ncbi:MAG: class I SAM-dependent RNA methyltransferase [Calditrichaeota bacterium]|nr:MAG: class I SAM-dependent RNA methyltransferase [Calditrichota bacterium]MBL1206725.1 class I SAM-dependent RNA methyltransferase [Calditrichota bacterium]NOG46551.1 class I SAM-dependent RNA methyltransferase [Calditrichota bacterium]
MYNYQKSYRYFAQVADDIKDIAEEELLSLGAKNTHLAYRGIHFTAEKESLYTINFNSRLINRVLAPIKTFACHSDQYLYKTAVKINWSDFLQTTDTFAVFATVSHSAIKHSKFAALRLKDAIADSFRENIGQRPSVDTRNPDVWINLHIENNEAVISIDTSGGSLHRRGYRRRSVQAPMVETLAAAIIKYSDWDGNTPLHDPFCGSGTILCEAFLKASATPASFLREKFGFEQLPDFDAKVWQQVKKDSLEKIVSISENLITGSDIALQAVKSSTYNSSLIDPKSLIKIVRKDVFEIESLENKTIIGNPPYGIRLNNEEDLSSFYKNFGDFLKQRCKGSTAYIYFGERKYIKNIGLKASWKKEISNGGLDGRLVKYELY